LVLHNSSTIPIMSKQTPLSMSVLPIQPEIGDRVEVYWPEDKTYYTGEVVAFNRSLNKFEVAYDDGDMENLNFAEEKWRFLSPKIRKHACLPPSPVDIRATHANFGPEQTKNRIHSPLTRRIVARTLWIWLKDAKHSISAHCILRLSLDTLYNAICDENVLRKILLDPTLNEKKKPVLIACSILLQAIQHSKKRKSMMR